MLVTRAVPATAAAAGVGSSTAGAAITTAAAVGITSHFCMWCAPASRVYAVLARQEDGQRRQHEI
eukprot:5829079-Prymnesium_polylepis.2